MFLAAGGAAVEMGAQARHCGVGVLAGELELDVAIELLEAGVAADFRLRRSEKPSQRLRRIGPSPSSVLQPIVEREAALVQVFA